jgi:hypothetical protein
MDLYSRPSVKSGADTASRGWRTLLNGSFRARSQNGAPPARAKPWQAALLVFVAAFCLYALTTSQEFQGYESETNAAAEAFVLTGDFIIDPESPLGVVGARGVPGEDGKPVPRAGLPSVLEKTPFYAVGKLGDDLVSDDDTSHYWRRGALTFADPFAAAAAAAFFFLVVWRLKRSMAWAISMAAIFTAASLAWPYSKAGMETVLMMGAVLLLAAVLYAQDGRSWRPWAAAGFGAGLVLADKPYGILAVLAILALLINPWRMADQRKRWQFLIAGAVPLLAWGVAFGAFNLTRTGGVLDTGKSDPELTLAAPLNALGFMVSPGKSLLLYSPVVIIGLLGLKPMWREHPRVARAIVGAFLGGLAVVAVLKFWSDETWGPRYIVWVSWLLLLPVPFWVTSLKRVRILAAVAVIAVGVQLLAVVAPPWALTLATRDLTTQPIFQRQPPWPLETPFGRDPIRWIPELSPLLFQTKLVASFVSVKLGGPAITTTYAPYEGPEARVTLDADTLAKYDFARPPIWWLHPHAGERGFAALLFVVAGAFSVAMLYRIGRASLRSPPAERVSVAAA